METKENNSSCDCSEEIGSTEGADNSEGGKEMGSTQEGSQPGPVSGQMPSPYGYFQSPSLYPGYYMTQSGIPQGQMPVYWMPSAAPYAQPGQVAPQGLGQTADVASLGGNPGSPPAVNSVNPQAAQTPDNSGTAVGYVPSSNDKNEQSNAVHGHHKEPSNDELKYGTYMDRPDDNVSHEYPPNPDVPVSSGLASFFQFDNDSFWKGILVGSLATLLLTNSTVKKGIMKTIIKASASVKGGVEELKEQLADVEAEVLHDINEIKK